MKKRVFDSIFIVMKEIKITIACPRCSSTNMVKMVKNHIKISKIIFVNTVLGSLLVIIA